MYSKKSDISFALVTLHLPLPVIKSFFPILSLPSNVGKAEASDLIEILETKKIETNDEDLVREDSLEDL